jgi:hypothetical protein
MQDVKNWLNEGGSYATGVSLFLLYCPEDDDMRELFTDEGETDFKRKALKTELQRLLRQGTSIQSSPAEEKKDTQGAAGTGMIGTNEVTQKSLGRWSHPDTMDEIERKLHDEWKPLYLEMCFLQDTIYDVAIAGKTDSYKRDNAGRMAHRILDLSKQCQRLYRRRDEYFTSGKVEEPKPAANDYAVDPIIAVKKMANVERYVREMKKRLKNNPGDATAKELLDKHQAALDHYKALLKIQ